MLRMTIGRALQPQLEELIRAKKWNDLRETLTGFDPSDTAEIMEALPDEDDAAIFRILPRDLAAQVFSHLPRDDQKALISLLSGDQLTSLLEWMTPDDRTRLFEGLPVQHSRRLLESLPPEQMKAASDLLGYPPETAGRYMTPEYVALRPDMTARESLDYIRQTGRSKETLSVLYVVDAHGRLVNDLRLAELVLADPDASVSKLSARSVVSVPVTMDREDVAREFEKYDREALPVIDDQGIMLGIITVDDVLDVLEHETTEDIQKIGGTEALDAPYKQTGFWQMVRKRGGWLAALFLGEMLTATAMGHFEHQIQKAAVLALFVPLIISSGGNSGGQATTIIIRSLALRELKLRDWWRVLGKELGTGLALGAFLGGIGFVRIVLWYHLGWHNYEGHPYLIALTVGCSLMGVVTLGSTVGSMLPFILRWAGLDPASASAPFVATLVDVAGLVMYFTIAVLLLRGAVL
jgi:magnesium transporter